MQAVVLGNPRKSAVLAPIAMIAMLVLGGSGNAFAAPQNPPLNVNVLNTPLPVTGSINVGGSVAATQSGTWQVGINGVPSIQSADLTELIDSFEGTVPGGAVFTQVVNFADTSWARSVQLITNCFLGDDCDNILVRVYTVVEGRSYLIDQHPMQHFLATTAVYEVIGTNISVQLINSNAEDGVNIGVAVFGRAN